MGEVRYHWRARKRLGLGRDDGPPLVWLVMEIAPKRPYCWSVADDLAPFAKHLLAK
jgi:hypothetical protein